MKIIENPEQLQAYHACLALGNFDGVHSAHRKVLSACVKMAERKKTVAGALLFRNFHKKMLTSLPERIAMMAECGIAFVYLVDFDEQFKNLSPQEFVDFLKKAKVCGVSVGYDYRFGKNAKGDTKTLQELADGIEVVVTPPVFAGGCPVASTDIREAVERADFSDAFSRLGRWFGIEGIVQSGFQNGQKLGFATANLVPEENRILPPDGVYSGWVFVDKHRFMSVINVGTNPTFSGKIRTVESHLLDFEGNLYGKDIRVEFYKQIRGEIRFSDMEALKKQIAKDCEQARTSLERMSEMFTGVILKANQTKTELGTYKLCGKTLSDRATKILSEAGAVGVVCASEFKVAQSENLIVVLPENMPLIRPETIGAMIEAHKKAGNRLTVAEGVPVYVVEKEAIIGEAGIQTALDALQQDGNFGTFLAEASELVAISDRVILAEAERLMQKRINETHMKNGVIMHFADTILIEEGVEIGADTEIYPNVILKAGTKIGKNCVIGSNSQIENSTIADGVDILSSVIVDSFVDEGTHVGPFAYIRPNTRVGKSVKVGDFVELKNANIGDGTKISHLTYVGDADVGERVNFGCGTVTVNYDGKKKYRTTIGDDCFIGCNTNLVAPVTVEDGGYTAAGSTITDTVPEKALAIARARQVNKTEWKDRRK